MIPDYHPASDRDCRHGFRASEPGRRIVRAACPHDCPDTCALDIGVEDGRAIAVRGGAMPCTAGTLRTKVARYLERSHTPLRNGPRVQRPR